jgi:hypothetical protein
VPAQLLGSGWHATTHRDGWRISCPFPKIRAGSGEETSEQLAAKADAFFKSYKLVDSKKREMETVDITSSLEPSSKKRKGKAMAAEDEEEVEEGAGDGEEENSSMEVDD